MDTHNGIPYQGDWRRQLHPVSRQRIVNKIMETFKKHIPVSGPEGLLELHNIAQMFEDKIFTSATSQSDYLRKISMKMLAFEIQSQGTTVTNITSSLDMLTLETESQDTMANKENESQGNMVNNITSSLDMQTESQGAVANNMTSNQVGPINEPLDPANGRPNRGDWRGKLKPRTRERNVNKLLNTMTKCLPYPGQDGLRQLRKLAQKFEEKIFTVAKRKSDYAMKILLKSIEIEIKLHSVTLANNMPWDQIGPSNKPVNPANGRPNQGDWRGTLKPKTRKKVINIIRNKLKKRLPIVSGQEGSHEFGKMAQSFEEWIFTAATSKADYVRQICLKTNALEIKCLGPEKNIIALKLTQLMNSSR